MSKIMRIVLPFVTAFVALLIGALLGGALVWVLKRPAEVEKVVEKTRDYTSAELDAACLTRVDEVGKQLTVATEGISSLEADVQAKQDKVAKLESEMKRRGESGKALSRELEAARGELAAVKQKLVEAIAEKDAIAKTLDITRERLVAQALLTDDARADARGNKWTTFLAQGQLTICERGNRKKLGKCRESVDAALAPFQQRYVHCMASGQEAPSLAEFANPKDAALPPFASWLAPDDKIVRGWYVLLCDPSLPASASSAADVAREMMEDAPEPARGDDLFPVEAPVVP